MMYASVIVSAYNRAGALKEKSLPCLLAQSDRDFEVILVDDGSTDKTAEVIKEFSKNLNIRYFFQKNSGVSVARNFGVREAKGDIVIFLDSDDELEPQCVQEIKKCFLENKTAEVIIPGFILKDEQGRKSYMRSVKRPAWMTGLGGGIALRRSVFADKNIFYDEGLRNFEDSDFGFRVVSRCELFFLDLPLYIYNFRSNIYRDADKNLSSDQSQLINNFKKFKEKNLDFYQSFGPEAMSYLFLWEGTLIADSDARVARNFFWQSFKLDKNLRNFSYFLLSASGSTIIYRSLHRLLIFLRRYYKIITN